MKGIGKGVRSFKEGMNELEKETKEIQRDLESTAKEPDEIRKIDEKK
jgi:Sec-independent protein translocase protein TatA